MPAAKGSVSPADGLARLDHSHSRRTPRGSLVGHWPIRVPLLLHLIERGLKKAIISARWTAGQSDAKAKNNNKRPCMTPRSGNNTGHLALWIGQAKNTPSSSSNHQ